MQADIDQNESMLMQHCSITNRCDGMNRCRRSIAALQADVDQNESDSDSADTTMQADIDQNESDADSAAYYKQQM